MQFSPVAIGLVVVGVLSVIVGIRGSNNAVFQTLTGHTTGDSGTVSPADLSGVSEIQGPPVDTSRPLNLGGITEYAGPLVRGNPMVRPGSGSPQRIGGI